MRRARLALPGCLLFLLATADANAQSNSSAGLQASSAGVQASSAGLQARERYEVAAGVRFVGPEPLGRVDANETNPGGGDFRLFTSESTLHALVGVEARLGVRMTRALRLEATGSYGASDLNVKLSADAEGAAAVTASERIQQFTVEGAAVLELTQWRLGARATPFVSGGAGYFRALHEDRVLVDEGPLWHAGGGVNLALRQGASTTLGVRLDARVLFQNGFVDDAVHAAPVFGTSVYVRF